MWGDDGSDDEYLAALDNFEARAATLPKQQQPCGNQTGLHTAPNQPAPLQQRNGAVAPPPPPPALPLSCPPVGLGQAALAAPLGAAGVRHLFRRPSVGGPGLAAPAPGAMPPAAGASPAPTSSGWRHQQDQQQPGPNHHHQLQQHQQHQRGSSGQAGVLQQAAPWSVGPPLPSTHQRQPGAQQQQQPSPWPAPQHIGAAHRPQPLQNPAWQPLVQQQQKPSSQHQQPAQMPAPQPPQQQQTQQQPPQQQQQQQQGCGSSAATTIPAPQPALVDAQQQAKTVGAGKQSAGGAANAQTAAAAPGAGEISRAAAVEHEAPAAAGEAAAASPGAASADAATATAAAGAQPKRKLKQLFDYLLVYDLEATCDSDKSKQPQPQEIIELSCVAVDTATLRLLPATFQRYVKPDQHPVLTQFCTELSGITQDMVDGGMPLREALAQHEAWLREQGILGKGRSFVPVTWRDWDLKVQMAMETKWRGIEQPKYLRRWVDLSAVFFKHSKTRGNLRSSVEAAGLQWEGRAHSAIDDARNTARLAVKLMQSGVILGITGSFSGVDASGRFKQATLQLGGGGSSSGSGKPSGGAAVSGPASGAGAGRAGGGRGSSGGGLGFGFGVQQQQPGKAKKKIYDADGAWNGCCFCGVRAKKRQVKRPGPNNGREFWSCGKFSMTGGGPNCDFFKFTSDIAAPPPAAKKQR